MSNNQTQITLIEDSLNVAKMTQDTRKNVNDLDIIFVDNKKNSTNTNASSG